MTPTKESAQRLRREDDASGTPHARAPVRLPSMRRFNVFDAAVSYEGDSPAGYRCGAVRVGPAIGAKRVGGTVYELPPGESVCPYHYERGDEEWLVVLEGRASVRHPDGEDEVGPGEVVCFPEGAAGAHKISNRSAASVRVLMLSTRRMPSVVVYPDSDKVGVYSEDERDDLLVRRSDAVDYWAGEPGIV